MLHMKAETRYPDDIVSIMLAILAEHNSILGNMGVPCLIALDTDHYVGYLI